MSRKVITAAFVTGAAVGTVAGLMSKKKNRLKVTKLVKQTKRHFEVLASEGIDFTRDKVAELQESLQKKVKDHIL